MVIRAWVNPTNPFYIKTLNNNKNWPVYIYIILYTAYNSKKRFHKSHTANAMRYYNNATKSVTPKKTHLKTHVR